MKKIIFPLLALVLLATGCRKDPDIINYYTGSEVRTAYYTVHDNQWMSNGDFYFVDCENPDITRAVLENGAVVACVWNADNWYDLPYVYPMETSAGVVVPENVRFQYREGMVTIVMQDMDGYLPDEVYGDMTFKVSVIRP
ncbi:MAG: membrane lipoprotein lipid attachment site-containing protein [Bacteroidales bacterium]|nr:membrane lipoprotein lipid attachment site-containing protein [Candidatus Colimorpha pelethequi]MCQ2261952.1 membrane lipoprotein lipid attachment site-containing protein [Bacteroidales bacterium]